jgi:hypothetical protein
MLRAWGQPKIDYSNYCYDTIRIMANGLSHSATPLKTRLAAERPGCKIPLKEVGASFSKPHHFFYKRRISSYSTYFVSTSSRHWHRRCAPLPRLA